MVRSGFGLATRLLGLGWYVALSIVLGVGGGLWLDGRLDVRPLFTLLGLALGLVVAFYGAYKMVQPLLNNEE
ncbi:MAG: AtpZ/AtpI family protein [Chloroflexi bacterium]|nr:AtpZ/AtpI family protein [Chloroflexota bacterium]MCZ6789572.1 AtpZ/AtpI family protein [Chloroflexota bacterium]MCZ6891700.1 AtpZ/AtpI family protein [Chloroflexota bacterium]